MTEALSFDFEDATAVQPEELSGGKYDGKAIDPKVREIIKVLSNIEDMSLSVALTKEYEGLKEPGGEVMSAGDPLPHINTVYDLFRRDSVWDLERSSRAGMKKMLNFLPPMYGVSLEEFITHQIERVKYLKYFSLTSLAFVHGFDTEVVVNLDKSWTLPGRYFDIVPHASDSSLRLKLSEFVPALYQIKSPKKPRYATKIVRVKGRISNIPRMGMEFMTAKLNPDTRTSHVNSWLEHEALKDNMIGFIVMGLERRVSQDMKDFETAEDADSDIVEKGELVTILSDDPPYITVQRTSLIRPKRFTVPPEPTPVDFVAKLTDVLAGVQSAMVDMYLRLEIPVWSISDHIDAAASVSGKIVHFAFVPNDDVKAEEVLNALKDIRVSSVEVVRESVDSMRRGTIDGYPMDSHRFVVLDIPDGPSFDKLTPREKFQFANTIWSTKFARMALVRGALAIFDMDTLSQHVDVGLFLERTGAKGSDVVSLRPKQLIGCDIRPGAKWMNKYPSDREKWLKRFASDKKRFGVHVERARQFATEDGEELTLDHVLEVITRSRSSKSMLDSQMVEIARAVPWELTQFPAFVKRIDRPIVGLLPPEKAKGKFDRRLELVEYMERTRDEFVTRIVTREYGKFDPRSGDDVEVILWETIYGEKDARELSHALDSHLRGIDPGLHSIIRLEILAHGLKFSNFEEYNFEPDQIEKLRALKRDSSAVAQIDEMLEFLPFTLEALKDPRANDLMFELKMSALDEKMQGKGPKYENRVFEELYLNEWWIRAATEQALYHKKPYPVFSDSFVYALEYFIEEVGLLPRYSLMEVWAQTRLLDGEYKLKTDATGAFESLSKYVDIMSKYGKSMHALRSVLRVIFVGDKIAGFTNNVAIMYPNRSRDMITPIRARVAGKIFSKYHDRFPKIDFVRTFNTLRGIESGLEKMPSKAFVSRAWERALDMQFIMETFTDYVIRHHVSKVLDVHSVPTDLLTYIASFTTESEVLIQLSITDMADAITPDVGTGLEPVIQTKIKLGDVREGRDRYGDRTQKRLYALLYRRVWWQKEKMSALRDSPLSKRRVAKIMEDNQPWDGLRGYYSVIRFDFTFEGNLDNTRPITEIAIEGDTTAIVPNISLQSKDPREATSSSMIKLSRTRFRTGKTIVNLNRLRDFP